MPAGAGEVLQSSRRPGSGRLQPWIPFDRLLLLMVRAEYRSVDDVSSVDRARTQQSIPTGDGSEGGVARRRRRQNVAEETEC